MSGEQAATIPQPSGFQFRTGLGPLRLGLISRFGVVGKDLCLVLPLAVVLGLLAVAGPMLAAFLSDGQLEQVRLLQPFLKPSSAGLYAWFLTMAILAGLTLSSAESEARTWHLLHQLPLRPGRVLLGKLAVGAVGILVQVLLVALVIWVSRNLRVPRFDLVYRELLLTLQMLLPTANDGFLAPQSGIPRLYGALGFILLFSLALSLGIGSLTRSLVLAAVALVSVCLTGAVLVEFGFVMDTYGRLGSGDRLTLYSLALALGLPLSWFGVREALKRDLGGSGQEAGGGSLTAALSNWWADARDDARMSTGFAGGLSGLEIVDPSRASFRRWAPRILVMLALVLLILIKAERSLDSLTGPALSISVPILLAVMGTVFWTAGELEPGSHIQGFLPVDRGYWLRRRLWDGAWFAGVGFGIAAAGLLISRYDSGAISGQGMRALGQAFPRTYWLPFLALGFVVHIVLLRPFFVAVAPGLALGVAWAVATGPVIVASIPDPVVAHLEPNTPWGYQLVLTGWTALLPPLWCLLVVVVLPVVILWYAWVHTQLSQEPLARRRLAGVLMLLALTYAQHLALRLPPWHLYSYILGRMGL